MQNSEPQFKVHGAGRRVLKKELAQIKSIMRNFWHYHQADKDMASFYGGHGNYPMSDELAEELFLSMKSRALALESRLSEPYV